jgi:hypothetical protein
LVCGPSRCWSWEIWSTHVHCEIITQMRITAKENCFLKI